MGRIGADGHTFILRLWMEPREIEDQAEEWRGEVRHVGTERTLYFRGLENLTPTVERLMRLVEN